jgi:hypothetical protein
MQWLWKLRTSASGRAWRDDDASDDGAQDDAEPQTVEVVWRRPPDAPAARRVRAVPTDRPNDDALPV